MNREFYISCRAISYFAILWINGFLVNSLPAADEKALIHAKNKSSANEYHNSAREDTLYSAGNQLLGTRWRLVEFRSMDDEIGTVRPEDSSLYTMHLDSNGTVTMKLNCNRATGSWSAENGENTGSGRFKIGPLAATRALCPPPSMDESIVAHSSFIRSYLLKGDSLYLNLMADGGVYVWTAETQVSSSSAIIHAAPENGGLRNWEVTATLHLHNKPSVSAGIVAICAPGTILDNLGCLNIEGKIWYEVQELGGGPRGYVFADYLKPAVAPDGIVAAGPDNSALRAGQGEFDATGTLPCAQYAGQPIGQCEFSVARSGGGYATVVIKNSGGGIRTIFFRMGKAVGADISEADGDLEFHATKESDLHLIRLGNERYEIPDAIIFGG